MTGDHTDGGDGIDLDAVQSLDEFARACDQLRGGRSAATLDMSKATLHALVHAKTVPSRETVEKFLEGCGRTDDAAQQPWWAAWERAITAHQPYPVGAVRVREARPRLLGVHASIQVDPGADVEDLPPYVPRDIDAALHNA